MPSSRPPNLFGTQRRKYFIYGTNNVRMVLSVEKVVAKFCRIIAVLEWDAGMAYLVSPMACYTLKKKSALESSTRQSHLLFYSLMGLVPLVSNPHHPLPVLSSPLLSSKSFNVNLVTVRNRFIFCCLMVTFLSCCKERHCTISQLWVCGPLESMDQTLKFLLNFYSVLIQWNSG